MNTKILMLSTVAFLGLIGIGLTFLPQEITAFFDLGTNHLFSLILQILGVLYLGFAIMNWMARNSLIGGMLAHW